MYFIFKETSSVVAVFEQLFSELFEGLQILTFLLQASCAGSIVTACLAKNILMSIYYQCN